MKMRTPFSYFDWIQLLDFPIGKKFGERLKEHENSEHHRASVREFKPRESIDQGMNARISRKHREQQKLRMPSLKAHLRTMKTLLRQDIPIRGHHDEYSNIYQFNLDKATFHEDLTTLLKHEKFFVTPFLANRSN